MTDILKSYTDLSSSTPRFQVSAVLQSIINAIPFTFDQSSRAALIRLLLKDLKSSNSKSRLLNKDAAQALLAVKTLGRTAGGSEPLTEPENLSILLALSHSLKDDKGASSEALRCVANTLLLYDHARSTFISKQVGGGDVCSVMLEKATTPDQIFTLARIMFLATASPSSYVLSLVEDKRHGRTIVDIIATKMDLSMVHILSGASLARDAMSELLKFTFNLLLHYPKLRQRMSSSKASKGEEYSGPNLDGLLPPMLRVYQSLPPTYPMPLVPPLTHVIHALVTIPITPSLRSMWFSSTLNSSHRTAGPRSPHLINTTNTTDSRGPPKAKTLDRALSVLSAGRRSMSSSVTTSLGFSSNDILIRTLDLLDIVFSYNFPHDSNPDSSAVRDAFKHNVGGSGMSADTSLDELVSPLTVFCTRICIMDETSRLRIREWIVPADLDRTQPLDERADFLGRCIRLLGSVYHTRLKASVGEMLYAACNSDPSLLSNLFGYGHVAGFLFNKGILSAPPPPSSSVPSGFSDQRVINPITGTYAQGPMQSVNEEMTEEEKAAEMDKLFDLFDRLDRSGAPPSHQRTISSPRLPSNQATSSHHRKSARKSVAG